MRMCRLALQILVIQASQTLAQPALSHNVIISELFPDPSGQSVLPAYEFIELKNRASAAFNLKNWKISDGSSTATISGDIILQPDSFLILCSNTSFALYSSYGKAVGLSNFPSLNNDKDIISLLSAEGRIIHAIAYNPLFYHNNIKAQGGWSIEMIDPANPCGAENNWKASISAGHASPGTKNSVEEPNIDEQAPVLLRTYTIDSTSIMAIFNEGMDSLSARASTAYRIEPDGWTVSDAEPKGPLFDKVALRTMRPLEPGKLYELNIRSVKDCAGNEIGSFHTAKLALPEKAQANDLVINEILFNPIASGFDYVEIYNRSNKTLDLHHLFLANKNSSGKFENMIRLVPEPYSLFPNEYRVFCINKEWLNQHYATKFPENILESASFPSMPDDKGHIFLVDEQENILDEIVYDERWHFELIHNPEGIALERIDPGEPAIDKNNWSSAASAAGYGTPGYKNSQYKNPSYAGGMVSIEPKTFSPDNDGLDDFIRLTYQMTEPNCSGSVTVYDSNGFAVCYPVKNALLGIKGSFLWNGLDENKRKLPMGIYIIVTEFMNTSGKTMRTKNAVILARRF
jgi:hypothetical protein